MFCDFNYFQYSKAAQETGLTLKVHKLKLRNINQTNGNVYFEKPPIYREKVYVLA